MNAGGSDGQSGIWSVDIAEGVIDEDFGGREWNVTLQSKDDSVKAMVDKRDTEKAERNRRKLAHERANIFLAIDAEVASGHAAATQRRIRERTAYGDAKVKDLIGGLIESGEVEMIDFEKTVGNNAKQPSKGFRRVEG